MKTLRIIIGTTFALAMAHAKEHDDATHWAYQPVKKSAVPKVK